MVVSKIFIFMSITRVVFIQDDFMMVLLTYQDFRPQTDRDVSAKDLDPFLSDCTSLNN